MNKVKDMHIHIRDGLENSVVFHNMIEYGVSIGIEEFLFLEHGFRISEKHTPILVDEKTANKLKNQIKYLNSVYPKIKVWSGIEIDYSKDKDFRNKTLKYIENNKFDFVIGAIHSMKLESDEYYKAIIDMINNYPIDIIAHIKMYENYQSQNLIHQIMKLCAIKDIYIELNTSDRSIWDIQQLKFMLTLMKKYGVNYTIGSDAHCLEEIGHNFQNISDFISNKRSIKK